MVVALLYEMQSPCNSFTLSLSGSDSCKSNKVGETTTILRWRSRCRAGDDGDHDGASEMEITSTVLRRWRSQAQDDDGHIISLILSTCDVYPLCILSCFD